jgi:dimethylamine monooxygenase subunit A
VFDSNANLSRGSGVSDSLPPPARYLPFEKGTYDVLPGLRPFGFDFGNGAADACVFQIDSRFSEYRSAKLDARRNQLVPTMLVDRFTAQTAADVTRFIIHRLVTEHPQWFEPRDERGLRLLTCRLTGETFCFNDDWQLVVDCNSVDVTPNYTCALDALACQVQEDLAVTSADDSGNRLSALHVCLPSHWLPEEKLGKDFAEVHSPVPGMEPFTQNQQRFVAKMLGATSGLVRFVWGLQWTDALNRHPSRCSQSERFDPQAQNAWLRVERQTIWGLPDSRASLFTIRPYLIDVREIKQDVCLSAALASAVTSMSSDSLRYKGLLDDKDAFLGWLKSSD